MTYSRANRGRAISGLLSRHRLVRRVFVLFLFTLLLICCGSFRARGRTWRVKPDQSGDVPTIQAAIDSASAGDTVFVGAGEYEVEGWIYCGLKSDLTILGEEPIGAATISAAQEHGWFSVDWSSSVIVKNLAFRNCVLALNWAALVTVEDNIFRDASGIVVESGGTSEIRNNRIVSGGISCGDYATDISIHHNTIAYNVDTTGQVTLHGISLETGRYSIHNNIIVNCGFGIYSIALSVTLGCNDVWGNESRDYYITGLPDPVGWNGNISLDPQFCGAKPDSSGNFYLQSDSPCAPGNHPDGFECGLIGREPVACGATAVERATWGGLKSIYR
jgi:hypothetical protein